MTLKDYINQSVLKKQKTELTTRDQDKILNKFNSLVLKEFNEKNIEYIQAEQNIFDAIENNFKAYFPEYEEFEEQVLELIFNNK